MQELWRAKLDDADRACEYGVVAGSVLVVASSPGLVGIDLETGERRWQFALEVTALQQPVAIADGKLFVLSAEPRRIQALDPETGEVIWSRTYSSGWPYAVAVIGGEVVTLAGSSVRVFSLDGEPLRSATLKAAYPMTVTEAPGGDYLMTGAKGSQSLFRVARESLEMEWSAKVTGGWTATLPATISGDTAIFHQYATWLAAYDVATGEQRWRKKKANGRHGLCHVVADGDVLCGTKALTKMRVSDGKVAWTVPGIRSFRPLDAETFVAATAADDVLTLSVRSTVTGDLVDELDLGPGLQFGVHDDMLSGLLLPADLASGRGVLTALQPGVVTAVGLSG